MKILARSLATAIIITGLAACGGGDANVVDDKEYNQLMSEAKSLQKKSVEVDHAWTTTDKAIEDAEAAKTAGDMDKAMKLAKKAKGLADLSYKQYESQKNATQAMPE